MWWVRQWAAPSPWRSLRQPRLVRSLTLACTWAEGDGRFLHTLESWISLAHRVPIEERDRHVLYPWLFTPEYGLSVSDAAGRQGHPARAPRGHARRPRLLPRACRSVQPHAAALPEVGALDVALGPPTALGNGGPRLNV